jgi:hypothetical protein
MLVQEQIDRTRSARLSLTCKPMSRAVYFDVSGSHSALTAPIAISHVTSPA